MYKPRKIAIMIFDDAELLDFAGPFEVFSVSNDMQTGDPLFEVYTVAAKDGPINARNGLSVNPTYTLATCPKPDIFLIPGGRGVRAELDNAVAIDWITSQASDAELVLSVCTGAWMLAQAGLLKGLAATTYHTAFDRLQEIEPNVALRPGERWVDNGRVITSAGVSAGIDMALHVVARLHGEDQAVHTARHMEYEYYLTHHLAK